MTEKEIEAFVASAIATRNDERNRVFEGVLELPVLNVEYDEYVKVQDVLALIHRGDWILGFTSDSF